MSPRTRLLIALTLVAPALALLPVERRIQRQRTFLKYGGAPVTMKLRDRLGQGLAIGLLAGFRGVVADFLWIGNQGYLERREWMRMYRNMEAVTVLQPQSTLFWDWSAWNMAWNIGYAVRHDPANRTTAAGLKREREWQERAREFLARGLRNVPNRYDLYFAMGWLYLRKFDDPRNAAHYFGLAAQFDDAPAYVVRLWARTLEQTGDVRGAYDCWKKIWQGRHTGQKHLWGIEERQLRRLEDLLQIPNDQRIFPKRSSDAAEWT